MECTPHDAFEEELHQVQQRAQLTCAVRSQDGGHPPGAVPSFSGASHVVFLGLGAVTQKRSLYRSVPCCALIILHIFQYAYDTSIVLKKQFIDCF